MIDKSVLVLWFGDYVSKKYPENFRYFHTPADLFRGVVGPFRSVCSRVDELNFHQWAGEEGLWATNQRIVRLCQRHRYDFVVWCSLNNEIFPSTFRVIQETGAQVIGLSFDDDTRHEWVKTWAPLVNHVVFNDPNFIGVYGHNAHYMPFPGASRADFPQLDLPKIYDVSFVGSCTPYRREWVEYLRGKGIDVKTFGNGWKGSGRVSHEEMVRVFNQSRVNLNLEQWEKPKIQLKARVFEIAMTGGFLLTPQTSGPRSTGVEYHDKEDLARKIKDYLENPYLTQLIGRLLREAVLPFSAESLAEQMLGLLYSPPLGVSAEYEQGCRAQALNHIKGRLARGHWGIALREVRGITKRP